MTLEEMEKLATIISTADGGCPHCITRLIDEMHQAFPEFKLTLTKERWSRPLRWDEEANESFPLVKVEQSPVNSEAA